MTYRIGIIAALFGELKPLVSDWSQQADGAYLTQRGSVAAIAVARGIGVVRAEQAVAIAETYGHLDALVSVGWAGGASCGVQPGTAYEIGEIIDSVSGERYATSAAASPIKLATLDHVAGRDEKRRFAESYGASLVDMEAAAVAQAARARGIPLY
jgi:adenosylhomocysteine nucleosidase